MKTNLRDRVQAVVLPITAELTNPFEIAQRDDALGVDFLQRDAGPVTGGYGDRL